MVRKICERADRVAIIVLHLTCRLVSFLGAVQQRTLPLRWLELRVSRKGARLGQSFLGRLSSEPVLTREGVLHVVGHHFEGLAEGLSRVLLLVSFRWIVIREVVTNGTV